MKAKNYFLTFFIIIMILFSQQVLADFNRWGEFKWGEKYGFSPELKDIVVYLKNLSQVNDKISEENLEDYINYAVIDGKKISLKDAIYIFKEIAKDKNK